MGREKGLIVAIVLNGVIPKFITVLRVCKHSDVISKSVRLQVLLCQVFQVTLGEVHLAGNGDNRLGAVNFNFDLSAFFHISCPSIDFNLLS